MSAETGDLFEGLRVDYGKRVASLAEARKLVEDVERLVESTESFYEDATRVANRARDLGAYSVERAVRWLSLPQVFDRYGFDATHSIAEAAANRWLRRQELRR